MPCHLGSIHLETKHIWEAVEILYIALSHAERTDEDSRLKVEFYLMLCFRASKEKRTYAGS